MKLIEYSEPPTSKNFLKEKSDSENIHDSNKEEDLEQLCSNAMKACLTYHKAYLEAQKREGLITKPVSFVRHLENNCMFIFTEGEYSQNLIDFVENLGKNNTKIVGYKSPRQYFGGNIKKGDILIKSLTKPHSYSLVDKNGLEHHLPLEIVEEFEAIFNYQKIF